MSAEDSNKIRDLETQMRRLEGEVRRLRGELEVGPEVQSEVAAAEKVSAPPLPSSVPQAQIRQASSPPPLPSRCLSPAPATTLSGGPPTLPPAATGKGERSGGSGVGGLERLLSRAGIVLLVVGLILGFKLSWDQGWVTPPLRVLFGTGLGIGLLVWARLIGPGRPALCQVIQGGGLASLFITVFAACALYQFVPVATAFVFIVAVVLLGLYLSMKDRAQTPALTALLGGLLGPLFLIESVDGIGPTVLYFSMLFVVGGWWHFRFGWRWLLGVGALAGFVVLAWMSTKGLEGWDKRLLTQAAVSAWWLAFGVVPVLRQWLLLNRDRLPAQLGPLGRATERLVDPVHLVILLVPLPGLFAVIATWDLAKQAAGLVALVVAVLYFLGSRAAMRAQVLHPSHMMRLVAVLCGGFGAFLLLEGDMALLFVGIVALLCLEAARRGGGERVLEVLGHGLLWVSFFWVFHHLTERGQTPVLINPRALVDAVIIGIMVFCSFRAGHFFSVLYWLAAQLLLLMWLTRELDGLPQGTAWITGSWGLYAVLLLVFAVTRGSSLLRRTGVTLVIITLFKLFVVDMATVDAVWRIALFLGLGGVFLVISFWLPRLGRGRK